MIHSTTILAVRDKDSVAIGGDGQVTFEKIERKIEQYQGNLPRAALELAKDWRQDKVLRKLEALMIVADKEKSLVISGSGDVIEPDGRVVAIGSGAGYAQAAARALAEHTDYPPRRIVEIAMRITASICIYTNDQITIEEL
ncbi:HslU--HslV peptidase proteolytic subunit [Candidatus Aerophobetes bacterium]|uniref:HslU--HslV peptidase proteolytic subunit n=1 Tax=Aerophobetes bacterium TaxID=2030807 RepID=A0A662D796_UNCAE|nr:MAG: HslU--HslV peptidase proteolytic subunit [Candidatus Aerophobetes bacterium]